MNDSIIRAVSTVSWKTSIETVTYWIRVVSFGCRTFSAGRYTAWVLFLKYYCDDLCIATGLFATGFTVLLGWIIIQIWKEWLVLGRWNSSFKRSQNLVSLRNLRPVWFSPLGSSKLHDFCVSSFPCLPHVQWWRNMKIILSAIGLQIPVLCKEQWVTNYSSVTGLGPQKTT